MKKLVSFVMLILTLSACSVGEDSKSEFVVLPIESVTMPSTFTVNQNSEIKVKYRRPTDCHIFNGFYYDINENTRTVAINAVKLNQDNCQPDTENLFEVPLYFKPTTDGTYVFKFFTGTNQSGVDQYLTYEVEVLP